MIDPALSFSGQVSTRHWQLAYSSLVIALGWIEGLRSGSRNRMFGRDVSLCKSCRLHGENAFAGSILILTVFLFPKSSSKTSSVDSAKSDQISISVILLYEKCSPSQDFAKYMCLWKVLLAFQRDHQCSKQRATNSTNSRPKNSMAKDSGSRAKVPAKEDKMIQGKLVLLVRVMTRLAATHVHSSCCFETSLAPEWKVRYLESDKLCNLNFG